MPSSGASWQLKKKYQCQNLHCHLHLHVGSPLLMSLYECSTALRNKSFMALQVFHGSSRLFQVPQSQGKMKYQKESALLWNNNSVLQSEQSVLWKSLYSTYYKNTPMTDAIRSRTENNFENNFLIWQKHLYIKNFMTAGIGSSHVAK